MEAIKEFNKEFHAVEFMKEIRSKLTEQYSEDRIKYSTFLKQSMEDFKKRQKEAFK